VAGISVSLLWARVVCFPQGGSGVPGRGTQLGEEEEGRVLPVRHGSPLAVPPWVPALSWPRGLRVDQQQAGRWMNTVTGNQRGNCLPSPSSSHGQQVRGAPGQHRRGGRKWSRVVTWLGSRERGREGQAGAGRLRLSSHRTPAICGPTLADLPGSGRDAGPRETGMTQASLQALLG
jgi:hypothetical protein